MYRHKFPALDRILITRTFAETCTHNEESERCAINMIFITKDLMNFRFHECSALAKCHKGRILLYTISESLNRTLTQKYARNIVITSGLTIVIMVAA